MSDDDGFPKPKGGRQPSADRTVIQPRPVGPKPPRGPLAKPGAAPSPPPSQKELPPASPPRQPLPNASQFPTPTRRPQVPPPAGTLATDASGRRVSGTSGNLQPPQPLPSGTGMAARGTQVTGFHAAVTPPPTLDPRALKKTTDPGSDNTEDLTWQRRPKSGQRLTFDDPAPNNHDHPTSRGFPWVATLVGISSVALVGGLVAAWILFGGRIAPPDQDLAQVADTAAATDPALALTRDGDLVGDQTSADTNDVNTTDADYGFDPDAEALREGGDVDFAALAESTIIALAGDPVTIVTRSDVRTREVFLELALLTTPALEIINDSAFAMTDTLLLDDGSLMSQLPGSEQSYAFSGAENAEDGPVGYDGEGDETDFDGFDAAAETANFGSTDLDQSDATGAKPDFSNQVFVGGRGTATPNAPALAAANTSSLRAKSVDEVSNAKVQEFIKTVYEDGDLAAELARHRVSERAAKSLAEQFALTYQIAEAQQRDVLAIIARPDKTSEDELQPVQVSLYREETYVGTIALGDDGTYGFGEDPWVGEALFERTKTEVAAGTYTLLDGVYSAGVRNNLPTAVIGEMLLLLSRQEDLKAPIHPGEAITVVYAPQPRDGDTGAGKVLYLGLSQRNNKQIDCYVLRPGDGTDFECATADGELKAGDGMFLPVKGRLTSKFGPRKHPILGEVKLHTGVDWAAPTGTPVYAAYPGRVTFAGVAGGYGNRIVLAHEGNTSTYYAHLVSFEPGIEPGVEVRQGQHIGNVGTTGRSTGPHLHFEFRESGVPKDPLTARTGGVGQVADNRIDSLEDMKKLIKDVLDKAG